MMMMKLRGVEVTVGREGLTDVLRLVQFLVQIGPLLRLYNPYILRLGIDKMHQKRVHHFETYRLL